MRICYVVPGLGGTTLGTSPLSTADTWVDYTALAAGLLGRLRLGADGMSPGPPEGVQLFAGDPLPDYYGAATLALQAALAASGYSVRGHGYDWRLDVAFTGGKLADRIRSEVAAADPCSIVGHSLGGLVARLAWRSLVRSGQSNLVRRIVTLGTPNWGSYGTVRIWSLDSELVTQLYYLSLAFGWTGVFPAPFRGGHFWTPQQIAALVSTWPSVYWTLPSLLAPDAAADPLREAIYQGGWPADRGVSAAWCAAATGSFQPQLAAADSLPPMSVLTTVAGTGSPTVGKLLSADRLGSPSAYLVSADGDGQVVSSSAWLPGSAQLEISGAHGDLPVIASGISGAAAVILDERPPPAPTPPLDVVPGTWQQILRGPPLARTANWFIDP